MEIRTYSWGAHGEYGEYFDVHVKTDTACVSEENLTYSEAADLAVRFLEDTVLAGATRCDVINRLIEADILDEELIKEWKEDSCE